MESPYLYDMLNVSYYDFMEIEDELDLGKNECATTAYAKARAAKEG